MSTIVFSGGGKSPFESETGFADRLTLTQAPDESFSVFYNMEKWEGLTFQEAGRHIGCRMMEILYQNKLINGCGY